MEQETKTALSLGWESFGCFLGAFAFSCLVFLPQCIELRAGSPPQLLPLIQTRRLRFFGHGARMGDLQDTSRALYTSIRGLPKDWRRRPGQDVHVAPGYGPWKQTSSRSITVWTQPGVSLRTEDDGSNLWKWLHSSQGHARDDDECIEGTGESSKLPHCVRHSLANWRTVFCIIMDVAQVSNID